MSEPFPPTLLLSWQRPDGRYAGAEVLRKIAGALPPERVRWAYLDTPAAAVPPGLPEARAFPPHGLHWRLRGTFAGHFYQGHMQAAHLATAIAQWVESFRPRVIWVLAELRAIGVARALADRLRVPVHATVHDDFDFARFTLPRLYYPVYRGAARALFRRVASVDAVSAELVEGLSRLAGRRLPGVVFPPSVAPATMTEGPAERDAAAVRETGTTIALCGSPRITPAQWTVFLHLLGALRRPVRVLAYTDSALIHSERPPAGVTVERRGYAPSEAELVRTFVREKADAAYLGLSDLPSQAMFAGRSLSSKLATYAAAALPVIVHGPVDSVAWRLVSRYGAGVHVADGSAAALERLRGLLDDPGAWRRAAEGSLNLCRTELNLAVNTERWAEQIRQTAGAGRAA